MNRIQYLTKHSGIMVRCPNLKCGYEWRYLGRFSFYATCPSCRRNVKISENKVKPLPPTKSRYLKSTEAAAKNIPAGAEYNNG